MADVIAEDLAAQMAGLKSLYESELVDALYGLGSWREGDLPSWLREAAPIVLEAERLATEVASTSMDARLEELLGDFDATDVDLSKVTGSAVRGGVPVDEVYSRAFKPIWQGIGRGVPVDESVSHGASRLSSMFNLDMERVVDLVNIERFSNEDRIVGHRRVLVGTVNCALCIVASTQLYHKKNLKPIHPGCNCKTVPVLSFENPNNTLDGDLLEQVHKGIQDQFGISSRDARAIDYRKILRIQEHGEYGPSLTYARYHFTGPNALKTPGE